MALSIVRRNALALGLLVGAFWTLDLVVNRQALLFRDIPWTQSLTALAVAFFLFGAASFFAFAGGFWTRAALVTLVPVIVCVIFELTVGSDLAYPYLSLVLSVPYAGLFFLGAVFIGGPFLV